jgi:hypothetical protein
MEHDVEKLTDRQIETRRRMLDAKVARLDRERIAMGAELARTRVELDKIEQEQQNRFADNAYISYSETWPWGWQAINMSRPQPRASIA